MSLKALETIALSEEKARQIRSAATARSRKSLEEAEAAVELLISAAETKADSEIRELVRQADEKAKEDANALAASTRNRQAAMEAHADRVLESVADRIVERIVNG